MLFINCSNREKNCFEILNKIKNDNDKLISLSNKKMDFCLGCERCQESIPKYCVLDDYITNYVYGEIIKEDNIVIASPIYMSNINGILKNLLDRMNPFYNHKLLKNKKIYLILSGYASKEDNQEEINSIIKYFEGISEWLYFDFKFLDYFVDSSDSEVIEENNKKIELIRNELGR